MKKTLILIAISILSLSNVYANKAITTNLRSPVPPKTFIQPQNINNPTIEYDIIEIEDGTRCYLQTTVIITWADGTNEHITFNAEAATCQEAGQILDLAIALQAICMTFGFGC